MKEVLTIQVGSFANFIGSHFWNFQDELLGLAGDPHCEPVFKNQCLNMDILYRTGENQQGIPTYTPRLVSVNLPGSLGALGSRGTLCSELLAPASSDVLTWAGKVSTELSEPCKKNLFLQRLLNEEQEKPSTSNMIEDVSNNSKSEISDKDVVDSLNDSVRFWTDFSKVQYHPQSLYELNGLWTSAQNFDNYGIGKDALLRTQHFEEMNERLRFFMEECDCIQGIQFIIDDSGGFSSVAEEFLEHIADEYSNTPRLLFSVREPGSYTNFRSPKQKVLRNLHDAVSFSRLSPLCNLVVPVGLPNLSTSKASKFLCIKDENPYQCSAVYASAIHSIGLPFRMEAARPTTDSYHVSGGMDFHGIIQTLAGQARQNPLCILDVAMPPPSLTVGQSLLGKLQSLTPEVAEDVEDLHAVEYLTIHGVLDSGVDQASISKVKDTVQAAYEDANCKPRFSHLSVARCPLPIPLPFPSIFGNLIGQHGELLRSPVTGSSRGSLDVHSIPMAARLRSSNAVLPFLNSRLGNLRKFGAERGAAGAELLRSWGFEKEETEDMAELLFNMVKALNPSSGGSSDTDSD